MMSGNQKGFSTVVFAFALVTLLSCFSPVSSYFALPRVTRTSDAVIIDYEGVGYSPFSVGRGYGQFVDPGFVPLPALNPYGMFFGGWPHFGRQISPSAISERAVEGAVTPPRPFLVVLRKSDAATNVFFCSGTLISETRVLLAAQCLETMSVYDISRVTVLIGLTSITPEVSGGTPVPASSVVHMTRRISRVVIHSGYNAATYANDIAIISLDMPVVFSNKVSAARLPAASTNPDQDSDQLALVMGWGPATAGAVSTEFRQGSVRIVANDDCRANTDYGKFITVNNLCISAAAADVTAPAVAAYTCPADVGGPVILNTAAPTPGTPAVWTVVGINSFTPDTACGATKKTGLKTRVSAFAAWIATYMV